MRPLEVVKVNRLLNGPLRWGRRVKELIQAILNFQNAINAFGEGIIVTIADLTHAGTDLMLGKLVTNGLSRVLATMIAVKDEPWWQRLDLAHGQR